MVWAGAIALAHAILIRFPHARFGLPKTYPLTTAQLILWLACDNSLHLVVKTR